MECSNMPKSEIRADRYATRTTPKYKKGFLLKKHAVSLYKDL